MGRAVQSVLVAFLLSLATEATGGGVAKSFVPFASQDGVTIEIARVGEETPWIRGTAELALPVERVAAVLSNYSRFGDCRRQ